MLRRLNESERMWDRLKTLLVYYSFEGNTDYAAQMIAEKTDADILRLRPLKEPPRGFLGLLVGGAMALRGEKVELAETDTDPDAYDRIVIGSPVWAGTCTPAVSSFLKKFPFEHKEVFLFVSSASGDGEKCLDEPTKLVTGNTVMGTLSLKKPLKYSNKAKVQVDRFVREILGAEAG